MQRFQGNLHLVVDYPFFMFKKISLFFSCAVMALVVLSCSKGRPSFDADIYSEFQISGQVVDSDGSEDVTGVAVCVYEAIVGRKAGEFERGSKIDSVLVSPEGKFTLYGRSCRGADEYKILKISDISPDDVQYETEETIIELYYSADAPNGAIGCTGRYSKEDLKLAISKNDSSQDTSQPAEGQ